MNFLLPARIPFESGLALITGDSMADAAQKVVIAVGQAA
jgi:hypothetical protein